MNVYSAYMHDSIIVRSYSYTGTREAISDDCFMHSGAVACI